MVYTIRRQCVEIPEMEYDDGAVILVLNTRGESENVSQDLKELLTYMRETSAEKAVNPKFRGIQEGIDFIKTDPAVREAYMTLGEEAADAKAEIVRLKAELKKYQEASRDNDG